MLEGRVALVTGGGRGIGRAHCLELAAHGATVVVNDLGVSLGGESAPSSEQPADQVVAEIEAAGGLAVADHTSVSDWSGTGELIARIVSDLGRLDVVVNNAGIIRDGMVVSLRESDLDAVLNVHLKGTFGLVHHACAHWRAEVKAGRAVSGRIINTTSGAGLVGNVGQAAYGAAKAGIANLTQVAGMEMARYGVTVNAISPIAFTRMLADTPGFSDHDPKPGWDVMDPANSSPVVAWLASEAADWITGQVLRVEGNTVVRLRPWMLDEVHYTGAAGVPLRAEDIDAALRTAFGLRPPGLSALSRLT